MEKRNIRCVALMASTFMSLTPFYAGNAYAGVGDWYLGAGIGISEMEPDTENTPFRIKDNRDYGAKLYLGYTLNERWSVEGYYSDLGNVTLKPEGSIGYRDYGVNGLFYFYRPEEAGEGLSAFVRGGVGRMENDTRLDYKRVYDSHFMYGAGVEYGLGNGMTLRADMDFYDKDSRLLAVGLRIDLGAKKEPVMVSPSPEPMPKPEPEPVAQAVPEPIPDPDSDGDGVPDSADACPGTGQGVQVDSRGCELERVILLKGVTFALNSNQLAGESAEVLVEVAESLKRYPAQKVEVAGHTDSQGNAAYNRSLSQKRADAVRDYLIEQGVPAENLSARGYGEDSPLADNTTAEGRAQNRRVELHLVDE